MAGVVLVSLALGACAQRPTASQRVAELSCEALLEAFDSAVEEAEVGWSGAARVEGFPYLRVNRFLASFRWESMGEEATASWIERMRALDRLGRGFEAARLPTTALGDIGASPEQLKPRMEACAAELQIADLKRPGRLAELRRAAVMGDDYSLAQRTFGLYPITFMPVSEGVVRLQRTIRADFAKDPSELPQVGQLLRYVPPDPAPASIPPVAARTDPLGVPEPTPSELETLYRAHAPVWEIDTSGLYDKPGVPYWRGPGEPAVQSGRPVTYRYHAWTRWNGQVLLQLSYLVWFSERPPRSKNDLLSGRLDGVVWRVTLLPDGQPLLYDSVHPCGCYHMFFPGAQLSVRPKLRRAPEPPLVPAGAPPWEVGSRVVLRLASGSHYLQAVYRDAAGEGISYRFRDYAELYQLEGPDGRPLGLFSPDGLVAGSERRERFVLWPMGVVSPGAMRGRGRQATAFIGRRHFDDADLIETVFETVVAADSAL